MGVGRATLWLCVVSSYFNLDSFTMEVVVPPTPSPSSEEEAFGGMPAIIPGTIQAEDFDGGGEGVGYSDTDTPNNGGVRCCCCAFSCCWCLKSKERIHFSTVSCSKLYGG